MSHEKELYDAICDVVGDLGNIKFGVLGAYYKTSTGQETAKAYIEGYLVPQVMIALKGLSRFMSRAHPPILLRPIKFPHGMEWYKNWKLERDYNFLQSHFPKKQLEELRRAVGAAKPGLEDAVMFYVTSSNSGHVDFSDGRMAPINRLNDALGIYQNMAGLVERL
ncbi:hypothetical protein HYY72_00490 [Candidatus Woesearchaeota archaeon]|nr:hypothetical protein [Candidatus Woesearchaeota archaeon]